MEDVTIACNILLELREYERNRAKHRRVLRVFRVFRVFRARNIRTNGYERISEFELSPVPLKIIWICRGITTAFIG